MADTTGVQVFVGPANQLELGTVTEGPTEVTLEKISDTKQRINFVISAPTSEVLAEAAASADSSAASAASAATAQGNAAASATAASNSATAAAGSLTAAQAARTDANAAAQSANDAIAAAAAAAPTDEQLMTIVQERLLPSNLALDTDGVPFISPGADNVVVLADTDGRPYFVS